jgi:hypothetical protein
MNAVRPMMSATPAIAPIAIPALVPPDRPLLVLSFVEEVAEAAAFEAEVETAPDDIGPFEDFWPDIVDDVLEVPLLLAELALAVTELTLLITEL